jgi:3-oxoacyl-[acyl-carrier protein] reductase
MKMNLDGRVGIVTGAGRGIGKEVALGLASEGVDLILNDVDESLGNETAKEIIEKTGRKVRLVLGDVSMEETANTLVKTAMQEFGKLDILINNAGISPKLPFWEITPEAFDKVISTNLRSIFICSKAAFEPMKKNGWGRIVNLSSLAGRHGAINSAAHYSASKAGIIGLTKTLARQMGKHNITVNCVAPGRIDTAMTRMLSPEKLKEVIERIPLRRLGTTEEVASVIVFLASDAAAYITGECVDITGGYTG